MAETLAIELRRAGAFDLDLLSVLHGACFAEGWGSGAFASLLSVPGTFAYVASIEAVPAGFVLARVTADEGEIQSLGVTPEARRRGLGAALLSAAVAEAARAGAKRLFLEVAEDNSAGQELYRAAGFETTGRRPAYYRRQGEPAAALILSRVLSDG